MLLVREPDPPAGGAAAERPFEVEMARAALVKALDHEPARAARMAGAAAGVVRFSPICCRHIA